MHLASREKPGVRLRRLPSVTLYHVNPASSTIKVGYVKIRGKTDMNFPMKGYEAKYDEAKYYVI